MSKELNDKIIRMMMLASAAQWVEEIGVQNEDEEVYLKMIESLETEHLNLGDEVEMMSRNVQRPQSN